MKHRKLRIAWSVAWGVVAVLLCVLWARSYWWYDVSTLIPNHSLASIRGRLLWDTPLAALPARGASAAASPPMRFGTYTFKLDEVVLFPLDPRVAPSGQIAFSIPTWGAVVATAAFGAISWLRFRFSLRTLLIATTLIAVVLGIIAWVLRAG